MHDSTVRLDLLVRLVNQIINVCAQGGIESSGELELDMIFLDRITWAQPGQPANFF